MERVSLTSGHCRYLILETTESTGKVIHNARQSTLLFEMMKTQQFLFYYSCKVVFLGILVFQMKSLC